MSLVRFHRVVTTGITLALAAVSAWRGQAFLARSGWGDLLLSLVAGASAVGLVVYLARLNRVFRRPPGPGVPRDAG